MTRWIVSYIDPGTGGLILQFALGGIAGLGAFARFRWKRMRNRFSARHRSSEDHGQVF